MPLMRVPAPLTRAWSGVPTPIRAPIAVLVRTIRMYADDSCGTYAAAIAYYAIFSLIPLSLVILSIFGLVVSKDRITTFVFDQFPLQETASVHQNVQEIVQRAQDISIAGLSFGVLALIWSSSGIFSAVRKGLNVASHRGSGRPYWHGKLMDIALIPALGVLIILSVGLTALSQVIIERAGHLGPLDFDTNLALRLSSYILPAMLSFSMFALLYRYVPTARPRWPEALSGAAFATVLFEGAKNLYALAFTLTAFSKDTALYASLGTALGLLLWLFVNASIMLLGAEFARAIRREAGATQKPGAAGETRQGAVAQRPAHRGGVG
ncbi:MAG TPA: YihY/virulence factor BrkB family protein [Tepidiformaceae bacterium]|nr:YihY/virulence factor BrkB family protein [Tepidiformaceae bacterium]